MWKWIVGALAMIALPILAAWATLIVMVLINSEYLCTDLSTAREN